MSISKNNNYSIIKLLETSVEYVKGVGPSLKNILEKKNIHTMFDLITFYPRDYEDRTVIKKINECLEIEDKNSTVLVEILDITSFTFQFRKKPMLLVSDGVSMCEIPLYSGVLPKFAEKGKKIYITGKFLRGRLNRLQCRAVDIEEPSSSPISYGKIVPIYPLTEGLSQKKLRTIIESLLDKVEKDIDYEIPDILKNNYRLKPFVKSVIEMHFPSSFKAIEDAKNTLIFEEFLLFQYIHLSRNRPNVLIKKKRYSNTDLASRIISSLPFKLTEEQQLVLSEIESDMFSDKQMFRLLQGDVGTGKTIISLLSSMYAVSNNYQATILVPTEILALQHYNTFKRIIKNAGLDSAINIELLTSSIDKDSRGYTLKRLREGRTHIIIGTHSLLSDEVVFHKLGFACVDEQHRFGVNQRNILLSKGEHVDFLLMTATPIPQSLAFTLFGELDLSIIMTKPNIGTIIHSKYKEKHERDHCYKFLKNRIDKGEQGYVVFPFIDENSIDNNFLNLSSEFERAKNNYFSDVKIAMIHGKMKDNEKYAIMDSFINNEIKVLFSTTVIEVGIDNKNATVMIVEGAERFGLSQLHQLRGRVGRGTKEGYCYFNLHTEMTDIVKQRIETICNYTDGFKISEMDLEIRGAGEFLGVKQSGIPDFKLGNIVKDKEIMKRAKEEMRSILSNEESKNKLLNNYSAFLKRANYLKKSIIEEE